MSVNVSAARKKCNSLNYNQLINCLNLPEAENGTGVEIIILSDIILDSNQIIRIDGKKNILIEGDRSEPTPTISETTSRIDSKKLSKNKKLNTSLIEITGNSHDITLRNLKLLDSYENSDNFKKNCRINDRFKSSRWDTNLCYAPLLIGSARGNSGNEFPTKILLAEITIVSNKSVLAEFRRTDDLSIIDSYFSHGTVFGLYFHPKFPHKNIYITNNEFANTGTNAINLSNIKDALIRNNLFTDNHRDPQFMSCGNSSASSKTLACSGGQLLLADNHNAPVQNITITGNTFTTSSINPDEKTTVGIEIKSGKLDKIQDIFIEGNTIVNNPRHAIQIHKGNHSNIQIRNNYACSNLVGFGQGNAIQPGVISVNQGKGIILDSNRIGPNCGNNPVWANFANTPTECKIAPDQNDCTITVEWKIHNLPPGYRPKILVNGTAFVSNNSDTQGSKELYLTTDQNKEIKLFINQLDTHPIAIMNVHGKK